MKSNREFHQKDHRSGAEDSAKKATKLAPIKKSGKEKRVLYEGIVDDVDNDIVEDYKKRESILDYFDDMEENEEINEDQLEDDMEDNW